MLIYFQLLILGLIVATFSLVMYIVSKKTKLKTTSYMKKQVIAGVIFGALAICGTEFGIPVNGATANVRDAAPIIAGLIFGAPSGIIAGVIGGVERFIAAYWGRGFYTQYACSISTILAGFYAAFLRRYMLDNKKPSPLFGVVATWIVEVIHMLFIFFFHFSDAKTAIELVKIVTIPMIFANCVSVGLACLYVWLLDRKNREETREKTISRQVQKWLLSVVLLCYGLTVFFIWAVQTNSSSQDAQNIIEINLNDVKADLSFAYVDGSYSTKDEAISDVLRTRRVGEEGYFISFSKDKQEIYNGGEKISIDEVILHQENEMFKTKIGEDKYYLMYVTDDDYYIIGAISYSEVYSMRDSVIYIVSFMETIIFAITFILIYFLIKKLVVNDILKINNKLHDITKGNLDIIVDVNSTREFRHLSKDINLTVEALKRYIDEASSRIDKELALAHSIQTSALPSVFPPFPQIKKYDLYASMSTAKEVGGDFYDFYMIGDKKVAFLIADVSGKGIPAAMFMMEAKTMIKSLAERGLEVNEVLTEANKKLCENNDAEMFVTVWMGILDIETDVIEYSNAGHNPPLIYKAGGSFEYVSSHPGFVLAGLDSVKYKKNTLTLKEGDRLFLYTDGVTEATNLDGKLYGEDRLKYFLDNNSEKKNNDLLHDLKLDVDKFVDGAEQFDDITMLIVDALVSNKKNVEVVKSFRAVDESLDEINEFVSTFLEEQGGTKKAINQIILATEEIFVNIAHYAYKDTDGDAKIKIKMVGSDAHISFIDSGPYFDPLKKEDPDITQSVEERQIGGLGIFMVKEMMDDVKYEYKNGENILTIIKTIK